MEDQEGQQGLDEQDLDEQDRGVGHADGVSKLYVAFGVPSIILFMVVLFAFTRWFNIPA